MASKMQAKKSEKLMSGKTGKTTLQKGKKVKKGAKFSCQVCGLVVSVDEECGCIETCDIICCGKQMKAKK